MNVYSIDNFINKDQCAYIVNSVSKIKIWESGGNDFWDNRCLNISTISDLLDPECSFIIINAIKNLQNVIKSHYKVDEIYPDLIQVVRWFPGMSQPPHADDMTDTDITGFEHRVFGSIIYLNDNYSGGETYYPKYNYSVTPKAGKLAIHPGDPDHLHGVTTIENNIRYTLASFWTKEKNKMYGW